MDPGQSVRAARLGTGPAVRALVPLSDGASITPEVHGQPECKAALHVLCAPLKQ